MGSSLTASGSGQPRPVGHEHRFPGNSIESLVGGATSFAASSTFAYEVNSSLLGSLGTAADLLVVSGSLSIAPGSLVTFTWRV